MVGANALVPRAILLSALLVTFVVLKLSVIEDKAWAEHLLAAM